MRVLIVEDDPGIGSFVKKGLTEMSCAVDLAHDGLDAFHLACTEAYDCLILDLMLPGKDGFSILRDLRERDVHTPVICLTARDGVEDRIKGLNLGADDYLPKPFRFAELWARMNAVIRRGQGLATRPILIADMTLDLLNRTVIRGGRRIDLTQREFALIQYLGKNAGRVLTRTMILDHVWNMQQDPLTNVVDVHINRLRRKIDHGFEKPLLHTMRGVGYVLREEA